MTAVRWIVSPIYKEHILNLIENESGVILIITPSKEERNEVYGWVRKGTTRPVINDISKKDICPILKSEQCVPTNYCQVCPIRKTPINKRLQNERSKILSLKSVADWESYGETMVSKRKMCIQKSYAELIESDSIIITTSQGALYHKYIMESQPASIIVLSSRELTQYASTSIHLNDKPNRKDRDKVITNYIDKLLVPALEATPYIEGEELSFYESFCEEVKVVLIEKRTDKLNLELKEPIENIRRLIEIEHDTNKRDNYLQALETMRDNLSRFLPITQDDVDIIHSSHKTDELVKEGKQLKLYQGNLHKITFVQTDGESTERRQLADKIFSSGADITLIDRSAYLEQYKGYWLGKNNTPFETSLDDSPQIDIALDNRKYRTLDLYHSLSTILEQLHCINQSVQSKGEKFLVITRNKRLCLVMKEEFKERYNYDLNLTYFNSPISEAELRRYGKFLFFGVPYLDPETSEWRRKYLEQMCKNSPHFNNFIRAETESKLIEYIGRIYAATRKTKNIVIFSCDKPLFSYEPFGWTKKNLKVHRLPKHIGYQERADQLMRYWFEDKKAGDRKLDEQTRNEILALLRRHKQGLTYTEMSKLLGRKKKYVRDNTLILKTRGMIVEEKQATGTRPKTVYKLPP